MVVSKFARRQVDDVKLLPVTAAARDRICCPLSIVREEYAFKSHRTVIAQCVRIKENTRFASQLIHDIHDILVLQSVVPVVIPFAVTFARCTYLFIVHQLRHTLQKFLADGNFLQKCIGDLVFCLNPSCRLGRSVVFQPAIRVGDLYAEVFVNSTVLICFRILQALSLRKHWNHKKN